MTAEEFCHKLHKEVDEEFGKGEISPFEMAGLLQYLASTFVLATAEVTRERNLGIKDLSE